MMCALIVLSIETGTIASNNYPASYLWDFKDYNYLNFNNTVNLSYIPHQGMPIDDSLIGYWNLNEGAGILLYDSTGNQNNGTVSSPTWVMGKYGNALHFNGKNDYVNVLNSVSLNQTSQLTISFWAKFKTGDIPAVEKGGSYLLYWDGTDQIFGRAYPNSAIGASGFSPDENWHQIAYTYAPNSQQALYFDGALVKKIATGNVSIVANANPLRFGYVYSASRNGTIDDVRIYNWALTTREVMALYTQPDPLSLTHYYTYQDSATNNTMIINVGNPQTGNGNVTLVTCTDFFADNRLMFKSNNSAIINLWSNLGKPIFTNGIWNSENYTTTIILNDSFIAELDWNRVPPVAYNLSMALTNAGNTSFFSALWADNRSLSNGGYIFSTNNTGRWLNSTWALFSSNPDWGNTTLTLNSTVGLTVSFREFANNSINAWGDSGMYTIETTAIYTTTPTPTSTGSPISHPTLTVGPTKTSPPLSMTATPNPAQNNDLPNEMILLIVTSVFLFFAVFALALKRGYLRIEIVSEESVEAF